MKGYRHYRTIHDTKKRGKNRDISKESLLSKAQEMFKRMNKEKFVQDLAKRFNNFSMRVDLVGTPEVSFVLAIQQGKLKFLTEKIYTDIAVGIHKEYFLELLKNPPEFGNMKIIHNNIFFRKGRVKLFEYAKPLLSSTLSSTFNGLLQKNKLSKVR